MYFVLQKCLYLPISAVVDRGSRSVLEQFRKRWVVSTGWRWNDDGN